MCRPGKAQIVVMGVVCFAVSHAMHNFRPSVIIKEIRRNEKNLRQIFLSSRDKQWEQGSCRTKFMQENPQRLRSRTNSPSAHKNGTLVAPNGQDAKSGTEYSGRLRKRVQPVLQQAGFEDAYDEYGYDDVDFKLRGGSKFKKGKHRKNKRHTFSTRDPSNQVKRGDDSKLTRLEKVLDWRRHYSAHSLMEDTYQ